MLQINKMSQAIVKLIEDVEKLQADVKNLKETEHIHFVPTIHREGDKVKDKLSDDEITHRAKLHNEIKERTAQRLNEGG